MFKIIDNAGDFRIKEYNERGDSLRVLDTVYKTRQEAEAELAKLESDEKGNSLNAPVPAPEAQQSAPEATSPAPATDDIAARGAVDEGQAPAAETAGPSAGEPSGDAGTGAPAGDASVSA